MQSLAVRLGVAAGLDLATACRLQYPPNAVRGLWIAAELALVSIDLAEVLGSAIALQILFRCPLPLGVLVTAGDVLVLLALQGRSALALEGLTLTLVAVIFLALCVALARAHAPAGAVLAGLVPSASLFSDAGKLYNSVAILGATVMPHNLYLHGALVQSRAFAKTAPGRKQALTYFTLDSCAGLGVATFINAAILVVAGASFFGRGLAEDTVTDLASATALLRPALGRTAATLFAVALLAAGQQATITSTLAGQVVLEGFLGRGVALKPWARRLATRGAAIVPALLVCLLSGSRGTSRLLNLSQVVLSLQLPFAVWPLVHITSMTSVCGALAAPPWLVRAGVATFLVLCGLNGFLLYQLAFG